MFWFFSLLSTRFCSLKKPKKKKGVTNVAMLAVCQHSFMWRHGVCAESDFTQTSIDLLICRLTVGFAALTLSFSFVCVSFCSASSRKVNKCYRGRSCPIIVHCRRVDQHHVNRFTAHVCSVESGICLVTIFGYTGGVQAPGHLPWFKYSWLLNVSHDTAIYDISLVKLHLN